MDWLTSKLLNQPDEGPESSKLLNNQDDINESLKHLVNLIVQLKMTIKIMYLHKYLLSDEIGPQANGRPY